MNSSARQGTTAINAEYTSALRRYELRLNETANFERKNNITERWTPEHPQYIEALEYVQHHTFICAVEELKGLVVQRLSELSKANLAGTGESTHLSRCFNKQLLGYKMRKHISKAITRRSATIRVALERYNKLAPRQRPPRPKLDYTDIIGYSMLGEFKLLKYSRHAILEKPWTMPLNREMSAKFFRLLRSRQLQVWVNFDNAKVQSTISTFNMQGEDTMAAEMHQWYQYRHRVNNIHRSRLSKIYALPGYSGVIPIAINNGTDHQDHEEEEGEEEASEEVLRLSDTLDCMRS